MTAWTEERTETAAKLWKEGYSAGRIARELGVTRNAVISKIHRLGIACRSGPSKPRLPAPPRAPRPRPVVVAAQPPANPAPTTPRKCMDNVVPLIGTTLHLGARDCKWPIGDPRHADFGFCGRTSAGEGPYCVDHARIAVNIDKKGGDAKTLARSLRRYL
jgi:GcrA cell cycle regulator